MSDKATKSPRRGGAGPFARRGLDRSTFDSWRDAIEAAGRPGERVLAWAVIADETIPIGGEAAGGAVPDAERGVVIGGPGVMSVRYPLLVGEQAWRHVGWHEIEKGEWNGDERELRWSTYDGDTGSARLAEPGRMPELFRERIAASIAVEEILEVGRGRKVTINGRRDLARPAEPLVWQRTLSRGLTPATPGLAELTEATLARLRSEYDPS